MVEMDGDGEGGVRQDSMSVLVGNEVTLGDSMDELVYQTTGSVSTMEAARGRQAEAGDASTAVGPSIADWLATFVLNLSKWDEDLESRMHHHLAEHQERERAWRAEQEE